MTFYGYIKMEYKDEVFVPTCVGNMAAPVARRKMQPVIIHILRKK